MGRTQAMLSGTPSVHVCLSLAGFSEGRIAVKKSYHTIAYPRFDDRQVLHIRRQGDENVRTTPEILKPIQCFHNHVAPRLKQQQSLPG
jgi:hypothetical protein